MSYDARDILDILWHDMHEDSRLAREVRSAVCVWADCDDVVIEPDGGVWVSNSPRMISDNEAESLVAYLQKQGIVEGVI